MPLKRIGSPATPEQQEEVKQAIECLRSDIKVVGNKLVEDFDEFLDSVEGSSEPADKAKAQVVLQRLKDFNLGPQSAESSTVTAATCTSSSASTSSTKKAGFWKRLLSLWSSIKKNSREDGSSKSSNPDTKA